jgi:hypothetical protein
MDLENRIAVCLSGQLRSGVEVAPFLMRFFGDLLPKIDFFLHTWTTNTHLVWDKSTGKFQDSETSSRVESGEFDYIRKFYKPVKMVVDDITEYEKRYHKRVVEKTGEGPVLIVGMFQSVYEADSYRREHERLHNQRYGIVLRLRYDIFFEPYHTLAKELNALNIQENSLYVSDMMKKVPLAVEDIAWIAKSETMDKVCDFVLEREIRKDMTGIDWQYHMRYYLYKHDITLHKWNENRLHILRKDPAHRLISNSPFDRDKLT